MTVQANLPPTNTNSDGTTTTFEYNFKVTREEHLKAMYTVIATGETGDLEIDSVTGIGDDGGGTVTFATAPADGMIVTINSIAPLSQIEAFTGNKLPPATVERAIDAQAIINQRQQSEINRTVRFPGSDEEIPTLPAKAQRADKILGFSADGSDFAMVEGAAASQAYVDLAEAQADRAVAAATHPYTGGEQKTGAFMPGAGESLTLFTYKAVSDAAVTLPALSGLAVGYNIGICRTAGSGDLTISAADGALINGASSIVLASDYLCLDLTINGAGDAWVATDKAIVGVPIGTGAGDLVALDGAAKLPSVDGSQLLNVRDDTARDTALTTFLRAETLADDPMGSYGKILSDNFVTDTATIKTNVVYDAVNDWYSVATTADDGTAGETQTNTAELNSGVGSNGGMQFTAAASGDVTQATIDIDAVTTPGDYHLEIWSNSGNNPSAQIGADSSTVNIASAGVKTFTWSTGPDLVSGTVYWIILVPEGASNVTAAMCAAVSGFKSCRNNTITSLDASSEVNASLDFIFGLTISTGAGDGVLQSSAFTLEEADPTDITALFRVEDIDPVTNNTDRIISFSIDNGVTFAVATISALGAYGSDDTLIKAVGSVETQTGDQFVWKCETANNKSQRIKQIVAVPAN
ncbi:choice-of-anchor R domain-containing protein [Thalassospira povalilytica]|uniref:choice-of-anchor R domain-containing protein n=1 Tax=Thalassospira povalilytica TaxID=732237 RepID=UPI001D18EE10|nr:choice-of-anchor R domain-containing protein [Thalassospira povalilytica]MCC4240389.1 hypothetical protein [Thalassospira povalilytica]